MEVLAKQLLLPTPINGTATLYTAPNAASVLLSKIILHNVSGVDVTVSLYLVDSGEPAIADRRVYSSVIRDKDTKSLSTVEGSIIGPKQSVILTTSNNVVASLTGATIQ